MTEINQQLLQMIMDNRSIEEICSILKLSRKQIINRLNSLKKDGYVYVPKYYYDGEIGLMLNHNYKSNEATIFTTPEDTNFRAVIISDLHIGSSLASLKYVEMVYDYCKKHNINIILNVGDLIEGQSDKIGKKFNLNICIKEINNIVYNYPFDKNILNFICLGNHDNDSLKKTGLDMSEILLATRSDLIPLGYEEVLIRIKNDKIRLIHPIKRLDERYFYNAIIFRGHSHKMKFVTAKQLYYVPSLSNIRKQDSPFLPSFLDFQARFNDGYMEHGVITILLVNDRVNKISEIEVDLLQGRELRKKNIITNEEPRIKTKKREVL